MGRVLFQSFSSGSNGNCCILALEEDSQITASVIIDAGVSLRKLKESLKPLGIAPDSLDAILITHDHNDHVRHLGSYCKHVGTPVWATAREHSFLAEYFLTKDWICGCRRVLSEDDWTQIVPGKIAVRQFHVPHDARETVGYAVKIGGYPFVIMTDIGDMTPEALAYASHARTVVIESNYDMDMLMSGPYTYELKMRICQGHGHLSNDKCADAIRRFMHPGLERIFLCHLSAHNNTPARAVECSREAVADVLGSEARTSFPLSALPRTEPSQLFVLSEF